jgi:alcohol dehydrogenase (nicotinoprotein)
VGATHAIATIEEAADLARSMTNGNGADKAEVSAVFVTITEAFHVIGKAGTLVLTGLNNLLNGKNVRGVLIHEH